MAEHDIVVQDAIILIDREQGAAEQLRHNGINLISILKLDVMLNYYHAKGLIDSTLYDRSVSYLREHQAPSKPPMDVADMPPLPPELDFDPDDGDEDGLN